ncbi:MAG TPA: tRNA (adenosine(37)-N6)-threonylcarbamoyltransferase complex dimerization subunit type 1 TsaB [Candidatus Dormibacteraeota bacterium]|nr:tRNA (adenosine(37)-N6)-threonylcarbamoyltransferase complex dimerization subunit type 1 TsaB [Candidatus Dormibacteraeota bacterium]
MLILAIDTSTRTGSIALVRDDQLVAEISGYEETPHSTRLFRDLSVLQSKAQFSMGQIDLFAVASGPGSFTGLRVGLTAVKAWAEVHGKPIAAVSALEAIAAQSAGAPVSGGETGIIAPFLDARRGQIFGSLYRRRQANPATLQRMVEESILSPEEFLELVKGNVPLGRPVLVSPTAEVLSGSLVSQMLPGVNVQAVSPILAPVIGRLGLEQAGRGELLDALRLDANYVRRSDAEAAWKDA